MAQSSHTPLLWHFGIEDEVSGPRYFKFKYTTLVTSLIYCRLSNYLPIDSGVGVSPGFTAVYP